MDKVITLAGEGHTQISIDCARLALIAISDDAHTMHVGYSDGTVQRFMSDDAPFDCARIARMVQASTGGFECCTNNTIIKLAHVKYAMISAADAASGACVLSLGVTGQGRIDLHMQRSCAEYVVERMNRERPTLNCPLADDAKLHFYPSAVVHGAHRTGDNFIRLDFASAGMLQVTPVVTARGFLTSVWQGTVAGVFNSYETDVCASVIERLQFQNDDIRFIKHTAGVDVVGRAGVTAVDDCRDNAAQICLSNGTVKYFVFDDAQSCRQALSALASHRVKRECKRAVAP